VKLRPHIVQPLAEQIMRAVRQHYLSSPGSPSQQLVFEALNGLAFAAGSVLAGTGGNEQVIEFFHTATAESMVDAMKLDKRSDEAAKPDGAKGIQ
jgi:hypothetical protein